MNGRLSPAQIRLLNEIHATERGVLYVRRFSRYARTIEALAARGRVRKVEPDHSSLGMDGWAATPDPFTRGDRETGAHAEACRDKSCLMCCRCWCHFATTDPTPQTDSADG